MKKYFFIFIFIAIIFNIFAEDFSISGSNELKFIYRNVEDSLNQFMEDKFKFDLSYGNFRFGMTYSAQLPEFNKFTPAAELSSNEISSSWVDRYLEFEADNFYIRGGIFDATFGSGIILNAYKNLDLDEDNRLEGCKTSANFNNVDIAGIYGVSNNDIVSGIDFEISPNDFIKIGFSGVNERFFIDYENGYSTKNIFDARAEFTQDLFDGKIEFAKNEKSDGIVEDSEGTALYGNINTYFDKFTLSAFYKKYDNFVDRFSELPTVNYSEQAIAEYGNHQNLGYEEEGFQGIIQFFPNYENEFILNYAEGWSFDKAVKQSDLHTEFIHLFANSSLKFEYSQLEHITDSPTTYYWSKETKPAISYDFIYGGTPILLKTNFKTKIKDYYGEESSTYEPSFQADVDFHKFSLSIIATHEFHEFTEISNTLPKIGAELVASIWSHSDIKLFIGSEKGGQVCRNGVCQNQVAFDGIRLTVSTKF